MKIIVLSSKTRLISLTLISFSSFSIPFLLGQPQLLVGSLVNACLFLSAFSFPSQINPVIFLPSLGVISRGIIFGSLTFYLILMTPFIWLGNFLLVKIFNKLIRQSFSFLPAVFLSSFVKASFLYLIAFTLINLKILPNFFLISMGSIQLITALLGGLGAFLVKKYVFPRTK